MQGQQLQLGPQDLLDVTQLSREDVISILDIAKSFDEINRRPVKAPTLRGKTVVLFLPKTARARKHPLMRPASAFRPTPLPFHFRLEHQQGRNHSRTRA